MTMLEATIEAAMKTMPQICIYVIAIRFDHDYHGHD